MTTAIVAYDLGAAKLAAARLGLRRSAWQPIATPFDSAGHRFDRIVYVEGWERSPYVLADALAAMRRSTLGNAQEVDAERATYISRPVLASQATAELRAQRERREIPAFLDFTAVEVERPARSVGGRIWRTLAHAIRGQRVVAYRRGRS